MEVLILKNVLRTMSELIAFIQMETERLQAYARMYTDMSQMVPHQVHTLDMSV